jgi:hypothetical protein
MTSSHRQISQVNMAVRLRPCYSMLLDAESSQSRQYAFVFRVRPDCLFLKRMPHAAMLHRAQSQGRELLLYDDIVAVASRQYAAALYMVPSVVYSSCVTVEVWRYTCNMTFDWPVVKRLSKCPPCVPCPAMALTSWFAQYQTGLGKLRWTAWQLGACSLRLERYTASGNRIVTVRGTKYALEAAQRKQNNCTASWEV